MDITTARHQLAGITTALDLLEAGGVAHICGASVGSLGPMIHVYGGDDGRGAWASVVAALPGCAAEFAWHQSDLCCYATPPDVPVRVLVRVGGLSAGLDPAALGLVVP